MSGDFDEFEGVETYRLPRDESEQERVASWLVVLGASEARVVELLPGYTMTIGRAPECEVSVADRSVSRRHATLHVGEAGVEIEDLGSANGLVVAGVRMAPHARASVSPGSVIQIGAALFVLHAGPVAPLVEAPAIAVEAGRPGSAGPAVGGHVVVDEAMRRLHAMIARIAPTRLNVLLLGETGSGKEVLAEEIHARSPRADRAFVKINCAAIAPQLLESELFGHERGAFTGATHSRPGLLEAAHGGTLLLDEIGDMAPGLQAKLLRVIEDGRVMRIGSSSPRTVDVRFVAATNRDLGHEIARGTFRTDLYYRLNGVKLEIPPLRSRPSEILPLAKRFIALAAAGAPAPEVSDEVIEALHRHRWPGNVRELKNAIERAVALCDGRVLRLPHLPESVRSAQAPAVAARAAGVPARAAGDLREDLAALEKQRIVEALARCEGNQTEAAKLLGMPRRTLITRIEEYGLPRPRKGRRGGGGA